MVAVLRALLLALALVPLAASAQQVSPDDAKAIRAVIEAQLDAFRHDDAARAFSLATPGIRKTFGSAENFLAMVRASYAVVYRPKDVIFESTRYIEGQLVQPVRLTDVEGRSWIALYPMQRQPDGNWRTNGCQLSRLSGTQV
jgi:DNA-binding transcriptional LysR family regulator